MRYFIIKISAMDLDKLVFNWKIIAKAKTNIML